MYHTPQRERERERERHTHTQADLSLKKMLLIVLMVGLLSLKVFVRTNVIPAKDDRQMAQNANKTHLTSTNPKETAGSNYL